MENCAAIILAGGMSRRMQGADKAFLRLGDKSLLHILLSRIEPQCQTIVLSANGNLNRFQLFGLPIIPDDQPVSLGPLAGILAGLDWLAIHQTNITQMVSLPVDTPFIPNDLIARITANNGLTTASSGGQAHHAVSCWPVSLRAAVRHHLVGKGLRSLRAFLTTHHTRFVDWPIHSRDPFHNINDIEDLIKAEQWLGVAAD